MLDALESGVPMGFSMEFYAGRADSIGRAFSDVEWDGIRDGSAARHRLQEVRHAAPGAGPPPCLSSVTERRPAPSVDCPRSREPIFSASTSRWSLAVDPEAVIWHSPGTSDR